MIIPLLFGPYGYSAVEHIAQFAQYGANTLWFHGFDPAAFEACQQYQIAACVEFKTFRADFHNHPELIPIGVDCRPIRYGELVQGVCLSQQDFLDEIEVDLLMGIRTYQPVGIWLDYLTYPGWFETPSPDLQESCFCAACVTEFCESTGVDAVTPNEILVRYTEQWERHKCERIAKFAARYATLIRSYLPDCIIGAYMCPWTPSEYDGALTRIFAQDYEMLAPSIDVFTPLIYAQKSGKPNYWGREILGEMESFIPQERKVQLILDALDFPESLSETARASVPSWGLQLFGGVQVFRDQEKAKVFKTAVEDIQKRVEEVN